MSVEFEELSGWPKSGLIQCPIRFSLDQPTMRWGALKRRLKGITNTMLAGALAELQTAGLVKRTQYNEMPLRVEYSLTGIGHDLAPILRHLGQWGVEALKSETDIPSAAEVEEIIREAG